MHRYIVPLLVVLAACSGCEHSGSEDGGVADAPGVDAELGCMQRRELECAREVRAGRLDEGELDRCLAEISVACVGVGWTRCEPRYPQWNLCLASLRDAGRDALEVGEIVECTDEGLCGSPG